MFRSLTYVIGFLLAASLTATPIYAGDSRPLDRQPSYEIVADNDKHEGKEEKRHDRAEKREKIRHERKEAKIKEREGKEHKGDHVSGQQTAPQPPAHTSGSSTTEGGHVSGK